MFVIGGGYTHGLGCEVFDSFSRKFPCISSGRIKTLNQPHSEVVCIGDKIRVYYKTFYWESAVNTKVFVYDVINDCWTEKKIDIVNNLTASSFVKYTSVLNWVKCFSICEIHNFCYTFTVVYILCLLFKNLSYLYNFLCLCDVWLSYIISTSNNLIFKTIGWK